MADRVQQVGLAQPGVAVDQQRVVGLARRLGHRDGGRVREPVGRADDEGLEGVLRVEPGLERAAARRRSSRSVDVGALGRGRRRGILVDLSTCRLSTSSTRRLGVVGAGRTRRPRAAGSTVTAIRISRPKRIGEGVLELGAQPALELVAGEVVGHGDDRGALVQGDRLAGAQPGPLVGLQVVDHAAPGDVEVRRCCCSTRSRFPCRPARRRCRSSPVMARAQEPSGRPVASTTLSTGCEPGPLLVERAASETRVRALRIECFRRSEATFSAMWRRVTASCGSGWIRGPAGNLGRRRT